MDNGSDLHEVRLPLDAQFDIKFEEDLLGGVSIIEVDAERVAKKWEERILYSSDNEIQYTPSKLTFVPYYAWDNRSMGEMLVWIREEQ